MKEAQRRTSGEIPRGRKRWDGRAPDGCVAEAPTAKLAIPRRSRRSGRASATRWRCRAMPTLGSTSPSRWCRTGPTTPRQTSPPPIPRRWRYVAPNRPARPRPPVTELRLLTAPQRSDGGNPAILAGILVPHLVCTLFVVARAWSRIGLLRKWFLDDSLIVAAWVFSTAVCVVYSIAALSPNLGLAVVVSNTINKLTSESAPEYDHDTIRPYMLRTYLGLIFYQLCLCLTKLSILTFYLRMFTARPMERRLAWGTVIFVVIYGVPMLFMSVFQCHPIQGQFFGQPMKCFSFTPLLIASASLHTVTDAWLIVMVIPCIIRLDLPSRQKVALAIVLSLSVFVIAASLTRLQLSLHANYRPGGAGVQIANTLGFFVMTILECDIALICASAPTLRPLLARLWPRMGLGDSVRPHQDRDDFNSVNLTTVVSYHGYPWAESNAPGSRGKAGSAADMPMPVPPVPAFHRTPTTLSLRSFMSSMAPRSRGMTASSRPDDKTGLLNDAESRRSSVGFEQYFTYGEEKRMRSRSGSKGSALALGFNRWSGSQESLVLGLNDPASPKLSPVSPTFSGSTLQHIDTVDSRVEVPPADKATAAAAHGAYRPT